MVFLDPLRTGLTNSEFSLTRVTLSGQRIRKHTHLHTNSRHEWSVWVLTQLRECVCGGKRMDGWRRLMSAGTGRIVRHLMNECKLATVELIPPPRQDWKFSPLNDLLCESSSRSRQCNRFTMYCFSHSIPKCTIAHIKSETALQVCISPQRATPSF